MFDATTAGATWSESQLWHLIDERTKPDADTKAIDERIWSLFGSEWTVMATDLCGFSRRTSEFGIMHFLQVIQEFKKRVFPIVANYDGIVVKVEADSLILLFRTPQKALDCAIDMQRACDVLNVGRDPEFQILLCVGIGHGDVLRIGETDVFGHEVNGACNLGEDIAKAGEILLTGAALERLAESPGSTEPLDADVPGVTAAFRYLY